MKSVHARALVERETAIAAVIDAIDDVRRQRGGVVLFDGATGSGRSHLLDAASELAVQEGLLSLRAWGSADERQLQFGVVHQLFGARQAGADGIALDALLASPISEVLEKPPRGTERRLLFRRLYESLLRGSERAPIFLVIDDLHCADLASVEWIRFVQQRIATSNLLLVGSVSGAADETAGSLRAVRCDRTTRVVRLRGLSADGSARLLRRSFPGASTPACRVCHIVTGGNPRLLVALVAELRSEGLAGGEKEDIDLVGRPALARIVSSRLTSIGDGARAVADAVALLDEADDLVDVADVSGLDPLQVSDLVARLGQTGLLVQRRGMTRLHPVVRNVLVRDLPARQRAIGHRRAAWVLHRKGRSSDVVAAHLMHAPVRADRWAGARLREAASDAGAIDRHQRAATYLRQALALQAAEEETPFDLLLQLAKAEIATADRRALPRARHALERAGTEVEIAAATAVLSEALMLHDRPIEAQRELELALAAVHDATSRKTLCRDRELTAFYVEAHGGAEDGGEARSASPGATALRRALQGERREAVTRAAESVLAYSIPAEIDFWLALIALGLEEDYGMLARQLARVPDPGATGEPPPLAVVARRALKARLLLATGPVDKARAIARALLGEPASPARAPLIRPFVAATLAMIELELDDARAAELALDAATPSGRLPAGLFADMMGAARGSVRLAQRRFEEAYADFASCGARERRGGMRTPVYTSWRSGAALALVGLGQKPAAERLAHEEAAIADAARLPRARARALRALAQCLPPDRAVSALQTAVTGLACSSARPLQARILCELGNRLLACGCPDEAREKLLCARRLAVESAVPTVAERCADILVDVEGRRRRTRRLGTQRSLTTRERQIAELARDDMTNREIADHLEIATKTVEIHLGNIYRKLGIRSRFQISEVLPTHSVAMP